MENSRYGPLTRQIGANLRELRKARGVSLADVSERMRQLGTPLSLNGLSKIERGNRSVDLDEIAALARALRVPPLLLLFPLGREELVEVLPGATAGTWEAAKWFTGEDPFPTRSDDGWVVVGTDFEDWRDAAPAWFREQDKLYEEWNTAHLRLAAARTTAAMAETEGEARAAQREAEANERIVASVEALLRRHRANMRAAGLDPGEMTPNLAHIDHPEVAGDGPR